MSNLRPVTIWVVGALGLVALLGGCERSADETATSETTASTASIATASIATQSSPIPTQAQMDRFLAEGPEPTLRMISVADYWLHYKLMQATGIEQELGGEAQAIAALKALGEAYERRIRAAEVQLPEMIPAAFTGEGMSSGFMGMGLGSFLGMMSGGMISGAVSQMSDQQLAELNKAGPIKHSHENGAFEMQIGEDGSLSQSIEFNVTEHGLNGKVRMQSKMDACPDADGRVTVEIEVDSQMNVSGKPGTGGRLQTTFKYERYLGDDAHLINTADGSASELRVKMGGYENFESQSADITTGHERGGNAIFRHHAEQGFSIFRMDEVERTQKLLQSTELLQTLIAEMMLRGIGSASSPWESGRCINLTVTSSPAKRTGLKPGTTFDLEARPRTKPEGSPAGGTVTATLSGDSSLDPANSKVPSDARFKYAAPGERKKSASIAFESRSKRGVGKLSVPFDTNESVAYSAEGGADDFHGTGEICDLAAPFTIAGGGNTVRFTPSDENGGTYDYSGNMSGFAIFGHGTYTVTYAGDVAVSITATGPGSVKTPMGTVTDTGSEQYRLTPAQDCAAGGQ